MGVERMTTKTIIFSNEEPKEMTFEEARLQFMPMLIRYIRRANSKFIFNAVEEEDFKQEMEIELWRAYDQYEPERGLCFTTYLHNKLQKGVRNATYSKFSLKNQGQTVSMSAPRGEDDLKLEDLFPSNDDSTLDLDVSELIAIIKENVSSEEVEQDALRALLDKKDFSVQDLADKYGITRQAANQRIVKLKKKLQLAISTEYLEIV